MSSSPGRERDRDDDGRARNSRPRDRLGRPLPPGSVGIDRVPEDLDLPPEATLSWAQELLDQGYAFTAHEVLEGAWKGGPADERMLWQGLAQLAVGITHIQRDNPRGATTVLERAIAHIGRGTGVAPHAIDSDGLIQHAEHLIELLQRNIEPTPDQLRPRLTR